MKLETIMVFCESFFLPERIWRVRPEIVLLNPENIPPYDHSTFVETCTYYFKGKTARAVQAKAIERIYQDFDYEKILDYKFLNTEVVREKDVSRKEFYSLILGEDALPKQSYNAEHK